ncbi:MAG TPA: MATE family efflux transporter [Lachnospiraceae bacterium]|nr:MATE family efflux transporter [Lachnospiraceae bacterium]
MSISHIVGDKAFRDKLFQLALPIALQSLLVASVSAADAFMLGRFEQNSMAAVSLATQVQFVMTMFIGAVTMGGTVLGAQYYGKILEKTQKQVPSQDEALPTEQIDPGRALDHIFNIMMRGMILIDVLFWAACLFVPRLLMLFFTGDPELIRIGCRYLKIAGWSYLLVGFSQAYHAIMKISEHARMSLYVSIAAVLINIVLNAVLIFGLIGFPRLGAAGAAIATVISRAVELVWCIAVSYRKTYLHPQFRHLFLRNKLLSRDFFRLSLPVLGASLLWGVGFTSYTAIVGHLGADAAAAMSIAAVVRDLICCLCNGIASGGSILLGNELGAGNMERGKQYGIWLRNTSFLIGFLSTGIMLLTIPLCDQMILTDQARSYLNAMMTIQAFYLIGRCVNTVTINGVFDGGGDTMFDLYSLAVCMWGIAIPVALLGAFVFHWPVPLVYACTCLDEIGKIPWVMVRFKKYKWLKNLTR